MYPKLIISCFILLFFAISARASDTATTKPWNMKKSEYLEKFGHDSTSRAVINMWFQKRKNSVIKLSTVVLPIIAAAVSNAIIAATMSEGVIILPAYIFIFGQIADLPILAIGAGQQFFFSKKHLYKVLTSYEKTKTLPDYVSLRLKPKYYNR